MYWSSGPVAFLCGERNLMSFDRVFEVSVGFMLVYDALDEMVHLSLEWVMRDISADW